MSTEYIRYELASHSEEEFLAAYVKASEHLKAAPECMSYTMRQCEEDARAFILEIQWQSTQAHLDGFRKGPNFPPFLSHVRPFIAEIGEMRHYCSTGLAWSRAAETPGSGGA